MSNMNGVPDELFRVSRIVLGRQLTDSEQVRLVEAYNSQGTGSIYDRCLAAIEEGLGVELPSPMLLEKSASVDRVKVALTNLKLVAQAAAKR
jgi:hypothetical protein